MFITIWSYTDDFFSATGLTVLVQIVQTIVHFIFESYWDKHKPLDRFKDE